MWRCVLEDFFGGLAWLWDVVRIWAEPSQCILPIAIYEYVFFKLYIYIYTTCSIFGVKSKHPSNTRKEPLSSKTYFAYQSARDTTLTQCGWCQDVSTLFCVICPHILIVSNSWSFAAFLGVRHLVFTRTSSHAGKSFAEVFQFRPGAELWESQHFLINVPTVDSGRTVLTTPICIILNYINYP